MRRRRKALSSAFPCTLSLSSSVEGFGLPDFGAVGLAVLHVLTCQWDMSVEYENSGDQKILTEQGAALGWGSHALRPLRLATLAVSLRCIAGLYLGFLINAIDLLFSRCIKVWYSLGSRLPACWRESQGDQMV